MTSRLNDWMQLIVSLLTAGTLAVAGYLALRRWLRRWIAGVAKDSREAADQLRTSNGTTVAQYVEGMVKQIKDVAAVAHDSARRADNAYSLAEHTSRRLDDHILRGHDLELKPPV